MWLSSSRYLSRPPPTRPSPNLVLLACADVRVHARAQLQRNEAMRIVSNFLPERVLQAMAASAGDRDVIAWDFDCVCVLQSDIVGFTSLGSRVTPLELCTFLHDLFSRFDDLAIRLGVHKIETVG